MERTATRRELVRGGLALGATSLALGAAPASAAAEADTGTGASALAYAVQIERTALLAYRQVLATDVLRPAVRNQLQVLMAQEQQHVAKLEQILSGSGTAGAQGPTNLAAAQALLARHRVHRSLTKLPTQHDCLRLLINVESLTEGAYFAAIPKLGDPGLVRISAEIMGADAQHWTVLSAIQHQDDVAMSVPYPFVQGSP